MLVFLWFGCGFGPAEDAPREAASERAPTLGTNDSTRNTVPVTGQPPGDQNLGLDDQPHPSVVDDAHTVEVHLQPGMDLPVCDPTIRLHDEKRNPGTRRCADPCDVSLSGAIAFAPYDRVHDLSDPAVDQGVLIRAGELRDARTVATHPFAHRTAPVVGPDIDPRCSVHLPDKSPSGVSVLQVGSYLDPLPKPAIPELVRQYPGSTVKLQNAWSVNLDADDAMEVIAVLEVDIPLSGRDFADASEAGLIIYDGETGLRQGWLVADYLGTPRVVGVFFLGFELNSAFHIGGRPEVFLFGDAGSYGAWQNVVIPLTVTDPGLAACELPRDDRCEGQD